MAVLTDLKTKDLSEDQMKLIESEIDKLDLSMEAPKRKKYISKQFNAFKKFLKEKYSLIPEGYYTGLGLALGMSFGVAFGSMYGDSIGISVGISLGMVIGLSIGRHKDMQAEKENRVLKTKLK